MSIFFCVTISPNEFFFQSSFFCAMNADLAALVNLLKPPFASEKDLEICCVHSARLLLLNPNLLPIPSKSLEYVLSIVLFYMRAMWSSTKLNTNRGFAEILAFLEIYGII